MNQPSDERDAPPRPLMSGPFWVMMAFAAICMAAAMIVAVDGPRLFVSPKPNVVQRPVKATPTTTAHPALGARDKEG